MKRKSTRHTLTRYMVRYEASKENVSSAFRESRERTTCHHLLNLWRDVSKIVSGAAGNPTGIVQVLYGHPSCALYSPVRDAVATSTRREAHPKIFYFLTFFELECGEAKR